MALIMIGSSICPICKEVLNDSYDITGFSAFVPNAKDALYLFNDAGVHISCINKHPYGSKALAMAEQCHEKLMQKKCWHSGEIITDYRLHFAVPVLSSEETEPLYSYNCLTLHKNNIRQWADREGFLQTARKFIADGKWANLYDYDFWRVVFKEMEG